MPRVSSRLTETHTPTKPEWPKPSPHRHRVGRRPGAPPAARGLSTHRSRTQTPPESACGREGKGGAGSGQQRRRRRRLELDGRMPHVPVRDLLVGMAHPQHRDLVKRTAHNLEADG